MWMRNDGNDGSKSGRDDKHRASVCFEVGPDHMSRCRRTCVALRVAFIRLDRERMKLLAERVGVLAIARAGRVGGMLPIGTVLLG
jgi:hypothetical protein